MSDNSVFTTNWNDASEIESSYTRPSIMALLAALFGASSFLVYVTHWFFFLGIVAFLLSFAAFRAIRNAEGLLTGMPFAYIGLCTAVTALVSIVVFWSVYQYGVRREADQFFRLWFFAVQQGDIPRVRGYQAIYSHRSQAPDADAWWKEQYENKYLHHALHQCVENKLVRVLMALGDQANVTCYRTLDVVSERESDTVTTVYAVTFLAESGETETFFVKIIGTRTHLTGSLDFKAAGWKIDELPTFCLPDEFQNTH